MKVEPNLDFNIISPLDYSNSWQYVLVLSFEVILHRPTSEKVVPTLSTGWQEEKCNAAYFQSCHSSPGTGSGPCGFCLMLTGLTGSTDYPSMAVQCHTGPLSVIPKKWLDPISFLVYNAGKKSQGHISQNRLYYFNQSFQGISESELISKAQHVWHQPVGFFSVVSQCSVLLVVADVFTQVFKQWSYSDC